MSVVRQQIPSAPLLSICIPTYNQPREIQNLLDSLTQQVMSDVEIVIRDDSSDTKTEEIVNRYRDRLPIRYFRGEKIGVDKAIIFITQEAAGKYVWWFGDDVMAPGAVEYALQLVRQHQDISLIWINSIPMEGGMLSLDFGKDKFFRDRNEVLEQVGDLLGFISATLFMREDALPGIKHAERHVGSAFVTLYLILYVLSGGGRFYYVQTPYVLAQSKPASQSLWYDPFQVFAVNLYRVVTDDEFKKKFSPASVKRMLANNLDSICRTILVHRAKGYTHGLGSKSPKLGMLFSLYWKFPAFWRALPFLIAPRFLVRILYRLYKVFFRETRLRLRDNSQFER